MWVLLCLVLYLTQNTDSSLRFQEVSRQRRLVSWIPKYARNPPILTQRPYFVDEQKIKYKRKSKYAFSGHNTINQIQTKQQIKSHHKFPKRRDKTVNGPQKSHHKHRDRIDNESPKSHRKGDKRSGRTANSNKPAKSHDNLKDGNAAARECWGGVVPYPVHLPNGWFYQRLCTTQNGLMVVSSSAVPELALEKTAFIIRRITKYVNRKVIRQMKRAQFRQAVMGIKEITYDIPEHSWLKKAYPDGRYASNRGIGATSSHPVGSNAEENVLCYSNDTYWDEDITIHEFAHSIHLLGFKPTFTNFEKRLKRLYKNAKRRELWSQYYWHQHVYAIKNYQEYFAVGVQSYFGRAARHNAPKKRSGLKKLDPKLFRFIDKYFGRNPWRGKDCHCAASNTLQCKLQN